MRKCDFEQYIRNEADFNDFLCGKSEEKPTTQSSWVRKIREAMRTDHKVVRTHGHLHPRNVIVEWRDDETVEGGKSLRVVTLVNWDVGGWYPEHWEFVKAVSSVDPQGPLADWPKYLPTDAIGEWPAELGIDHLITQAIEEGDLA